MGLKIRNSGWINKQLQMARRIKKVNRIPKPSGRPVGPTVTKKQFLDAMNDTWGIKSWIAEKLGVAPTTVDRLLDRPDWGDVREAYTDECRKMCDDSLRKLKQAIENGNVFNTIDTATAKWILERRMRDQFGNQSKTIIEGGENPIKTQSTVLTLDALNLPVELQRRILEHMDAKEESERQLKGQIIGAVVEPSEPKQLEHETTESEDETE